MDASQFGQDGYVREAAYDALMCLPDDSEVLKTSSIMKKCAGLVVLGYLAAGALQDSCDVLANSSCSSNPTCLDDSRLHAKPLPAPVHEYAPTRLAGVVAYSFSVESWDLLDSLYFSVLTLTTTGYGDIVPSTHKAKVRAALPHFQLSHRERAQPTWVHQVHGMLISLSIALIAASLPGIHYCLRVHRLFVGLILHGHLHWRLSGAQHRNEKPRRAERTGSNPT